MNNFRLIYVKIYRNTIHGVKVEQKVV